MLPLKDLNMSCSKLHSIWFVTDWNGFNFWPKTWNLIETPNHPKGWAFAWLWFHFSFEEPE
jgi:hypothetical protein